MHGSTSTPSGPTSVVQAIAPSGTTAPSISGAAQDRQTLTASNGSWSGSTPLQYSYQWRTCDTSGNNCQNISGATGLSYTLASSDVGNTIEVSVTADNTSLPGGGSASTSSSITSAVQALAPSDTNGAIDLGRRAGWAHADRK